MKTFLPILIFYFHKKYFYVFASFYEIDISISFGLMGANDDHAIIKTKLV